jgi:hypothetical protein
LADPLADRSRTSTSSSKSIPEVMSELWELTTTYAKQQTIDPLRGVLRFLAFGLGGAIFWGIGLVLLLLAALRALQTQAGSWVTGNLSWLPYVITMAAGIVIMVIGLSRISKRKGPGA